MKTFVWILVAMLAISLKASAQETTVPPEQKFVGVVTNIKGKIYIRNSKKDPPHELTEKNGVGKLLLAGQILECPKGAYLSIKLNSNDKEKEIVPGKKYLVPNIPSSASESLLSKYFRRAGRQRSADFIISPTDGGIVSPDTLVFRWSPLIDSSLFLSLQVRGSDKPIWVEGGIDGTQGRFSCDSARMALKLVREKNPDAQVEFAIKIRNGIRGISEEVIFNILSREREKLLTQELAMWDKEAYFLRSLGRANAFSINQLYPEAAEEYETLLSTSPESEDLIIATIYAHRRAHNKTREDELTKRLPPGVSIPD
jgi:hypothetical protein